MYANLIDNKIVFLLKFSCIFKVSLFENIFTSGVTAESDVHILTYTCTKIMYMPVHIFLYINVDIIYLTFMNYMYESACLMCMYIIIK